MSYFKIAFVAAAVLTIAASAPTSEQRKFVVVDRTTADTGTARVHDPDVEPASCNHDDLYIAVKCSGDDDTSYQEVGNVLELTCDEDDSGITWRDNYETDRSGTVSWRCPLATVRSTTNPTAKRSSQNVILTGTMSICDDYDITTQTGCGSSSS